MTLIIIGMHLLNQCVRGKLGVSVGSRRSSSYWFSKFDCDHCAKKLQIPECKACDKMVNYFKIFNIPEQYNIDAKTIKNMAKDLQKEFHPDRFSEEGNVALHDKMVKYSAYINQAKATLLNDMHRASYLLQLRGVYLQESIDVKDSKFMMDIFQIQQQIEQADAKGAEKIKKRLQDILVDLQREFDNFFASNDMEKCREFMIKYRYLHAALAHSKLKIAQKQEQAEHH